MITLVVGSEIERNVVFEAILDHDREGDVMATTQSTLLPPYVLFNHPKHRATLAIRLDENFSTSAILRRLEEYEKKYGDHT